MTNIEDLPEEIILHMLRILSVSDRARFSLTSSRFQRICRDPSLTTNIITEEEARLNLEGLRSVLNQHSTTLKISFKTHQVLSRALIRRVSMAMPSLRILTLERCRMVSRDRMRLSDWPQSMVAVSSPRDFPTQVVCLNLNDCQFEDFRWDFCTIRLHHWEHFFRGQDSRTNQAQGESSTR